MPVRITVTGGECQGDIHKIGQAFTIDETTPKGICTDAWHAITPYLIALRSGGNFSWEEEKGMVTIHCPDPKGITLELRRIEK